jgi:beta-glucosidase
MCAYNRVTQKYSCSNPELLNGVLKTDLGFRGYVLSDWYITPRLSPSSLTTRHFYQGGLHMPHPMLLLG